MLKDAALDCYEQCGKSTLPRGADLFQVHEWVQRLEDEATDWLQPVMEITSKHPQQRMKQAEESVAVQVDSLKSQLDEIPAIERSMSKTAGEAVKLMEKMARLESDISQEQKDLGKEMQKLQQMREDAGTFRRINLAYQFRRRKNLQGQASLRETITSSSSEKGLQLDKFNKLKKTYNGEFQARNELKQKYGKSVDVLPQPPTPSASALVWKAEIAKLDDYAIATEFDKACINHHLDSLASKFPAGDIETTDSFGSKYVTDIAKKYVSEIKDQKTLPAVALGKALGEGRISSVLQIQKAPDTTGFNNVINSEEEPLIPALRTPGSPSVHPTVTEDTPPEAAPLTDATMDADNFAQLMKETLEFTDLSEADFEQMIPGLEQMLGDQTLSKDGLTALAEFFELCLSAEDENDPSNQWTADGLMPGLEAGLNILKTGGSTDEAVDAMDRYLREETQVNQTIDPLSDTDSLMGDTASIQVSTYIDAIFDSSSPARSGIITQDDQNLLMQQLAEAHEDPRIEEGDLDMVAYRLHKALLDTPPSETSQTVDFNRVTAALSGATDQLINFQSLDGATAVINEQLANLSSPNSPAQDKRQGNDALTYDEIEV